MTYPSSRWPQSNKIETGFERATSAAGLKQYEDNFEASKQRGPCRWLPFNGFCSAGEFPAMSLLQSRSYFRLIISIFGFLTCQLCVLLIKPSRERMLKISNNALVSGLFLIFIIISKFCVNYILIPQGKKKRKRSEKCLSNNSV